MVATLMIYGLSTQVLRKSGRPSWAASLDPADPSRSTKQDRFHRCASVSAICTIKWQKSSEGSPFGVCNRRISMPQAC